MKGPGLTLSGAPLQINQRNRANRTVKNGITDNGNAYAVIHESK
jgi:hypothetical protein